MNSATYIGTVLLAVALPCGLQAQKKPATHQYSHGDLKIPKAAAEEAMAKEFSIQRAADHLDDGARAWAGQRDCVSCHTTGSYLRYRPALTPYLGPPLRDTRDFFIAELRELQALPAKKFKSGTSTAQAVYIAAGLTEWDAHVAQKLSPETKEALEFVFSLQLRNGAWQSLDCWPPYESSAFQEATVAAMAAAVAPGWLESAADETLKKKYSKLVAYLRDAAPPHDYARLLKLWTATRIPEVADEAKRERIVDSIFSRQNEDGGWSIRAFAKPEEWGSGNRAEKLRAEPEFENPASDGHMTGLAAFVLREAGVPAADPRIRKAVTWLKANQRESGRWWTRSLNTDRFHFITYSGTAYPLLALMKCGELPKREDRKR